MKFSVEKLWLDAVWKCKEKPNYGMRNIDAILEERASSKLELTGPLIDGFLCEVEKAIHAKLGRSRSTGLMPPVRLFVPYTILHHIFSIAVGYDGKLTNDNKTMSVTIETFENASKVLAPAKFSGTNFLKKRHFEKIRENGRSISSNHGGQQLLLANLPTTTFYIQRYNKEDFSLDLCLSK